MREAASEVEYDFPDDLDEAVRLRNDLVFEIASVQEQLGNRNRTHPDGTRFTDEEYWAWRHKAAGAWRHLNAEVRALKLHIRELSGQSSAPPGMRTRTAIVNDLVAAYRAGDPEGTGQYLAELAVMWEIRS